MQTEMAKRAKVSHPVPPSRLPAEVQQIDHARGEQGARAHHDHSLQACARDRAQRNRIIQKTPKRLKWLQNSRIAEAFQNVKKSERSGRVYRTDAGAARVGSDA